MEFTGEATGGAVTDIGEEPADEVDEVAGAKPVRSDNNELTPLVVAGVGSNETGLTGASPIMLPLWM